MALSRRFPLVIAVTAAIVLSGCGHSKAKASQSGLFDNQQQATITCMAHQTQQPGTLYTGGTNGADTGHILQMMQYYTSNGSKAYCDGGKSTATDQAWARLYVSLGGTATSVRSVLGGS